jgi:hypothetical protein
MVVESSGEGALKSLYMKGIFIQGGVKNANERVYPVSEIESAVETLNKQILEGYSVLGEVDHPDDLKINLDRVSHMIVDLRKEGTNYIGRAKIMETPMGNIARGLLDGGANLGVSSRALGSLKVNQEGINVVQDDFMLSTADDIVAYPSAPDAYVRGIMEGKEWVFVDGKFVEKHIEEAKSFIKKTSSRNLEEAKILAFQKFLSKIR